MRTYISSTPGSVPEFNLVLAQFFGFGSVYLFWVSRRMRSKALLLSKQVLELREKTSSNSKILQKTGTTGVSQILFRIAYPRLLIRFSCVQIPPAFLACHEAGLRTAAKSKTHLRVKHTTKPENKICDKPTGIYRKNKHVTCKLGKSSPQISFGVPAFYS